MRKDNYKKLRVERFFIRIRDMDCNKGRENENKRFCEIWRWKRALSISLTSKMRFLRGRIRRNQYGIRKAMNKKIWNSC